MASAGASVIPQLASELKLPVRGVTAALDLLGEGATVPFIARYRKERTGGLDEVQLRALAERHTALQELHARRGAVLRSLEEQGKLDPDLRARVLGCSTKAELEDLYLPFRPKRRTKATMARERGLEPLARRILEQPAGGDPQREALSFVDPSKDVPDVAAALSGARDIVVESVVEDARVRSLVREEYRGRGVVRARPIKSKVAELGRTRFEDYYDYSEPAARIPSHRWLAVLRGEDAGVLRVGIEVELESLEARVERLRGLRPASPFARELRAAISDALRKRLADSVETDVRAELKERADREAVRVFAGNLQNLLMAAPLGSAPVVGIDPGLRTGCKVAAIDATGRFLAHVTIYPFRGEAEKQQAATTLLAFLKRHAPRAVAIGNGTAGRETESFVRPLLEGQDVYVVLVSEAGASVYSASETAREEFPDLDLTIRGAISIARRLQDPLAELVKVDPKSIGVGQYQHDVDQALLGKQLDQVVETCVNAVGVELNTASAPLLSYVSGIGPKLARSIVEHRDSAGPFRDRRALLEVKGLGKRAFEQAAGFLRVRESSEALDRSAVHPERYALVARMAADLGVRKEALVGNAELAQRIEISRYFDDEIHEPTLRDIVLELQKPGRDPRSSFEPPTFRDDIRSIEDLKPGMVLEGVITNVTAFGAFVDLGVHQDGLVHISQLSDRFVRDPHEVARVGDKLKVRVLSVDLARRRISLSHRTATS